jgi:hypothetical protein
MDIGGSLTKIAYYSVLPLKKIVYDGIADPGEEVEVFFYFTYVRDLGELWMRTSRVLDEI